MTYLSPYDSVFSKHGRIFQFFFCLPMYSFTSGTKCRTQYSLRLYKYNYYNYFLLVNHTWDSPLYFNSIVLSLYSIIHSLTPLPFYNYNTSHSTLTQLYLTYSFINRIFHNWGSRRPDSHISISKGGLSERRGQTL